VNPSLSRNNVSILYCEAGNTLFDLCPETRNGCNLPFQRIFLDGELVAGNRVEEQDHAFAVGHLFHEDRVEAGEGALPDLDALAGDRVTFFGSSLTIPSSFIRSRMAAMISSSTSWGSGPKQMTRATPWVYLIVFSSSPSNRTKR